MHNCKNYGITIAPVTMFCSPESAMVVCNLTPEGMKYLRADRTWADTIFEAQMFDGRKAEEESGNSRLRYHYKNFRVDATSGEENRFIIFTDVGKDLRLYLRSEKFRECYRDEFYELGDQHKNIMRMGELDSEWTSRIEEAKRFDSHHVAVKVLIDILSKKVVRHNV